MTVYAQRRKANGWTVGYSVLLKVRGTHGIQLYDEVAAFFEAFV